METPVRSGVGWIDAAFDLCVRFLMWLAGVLGISYNEINVWIFCVLWPVLTLVLIVAVIWQWRKIRGLKMQLSKV